jgi:pimeloyl-ACP methyl ester carboxylesterase
MDQARYRRTPRRSCPLFAAVVFVAAGHAFSALQIQPLAAAGFRIVAPDMRGYNLSSKPDGVAAYDIGQLAADIRGLIQERGAETAMLAGHDRGGTALISIDRVVAGRPFYSGKYRCHGMNLQVMAAPDGEIVRGFRAAARRGVRPERRRVRSARARALIAWLCARRDRWTGHPHGGVAVPGTGRPCSTRTAATGRSDADPDSRGRREVSAALPGREVLVRRSPA